MNVLDLFDRTRELLQALVDGEPVPDDELHNVAVEFGCLIPVPEIDSPEG